MTMVSQCIIKYKYQNVLCINIQRPSSGNDVERKYHKHVNNQTKFVSDYLIGKNH
jgi:hypothetical protein